MLSIAASLRMVLDILTSTPHVFPPVFHCLFVCLAIFRRREMRYGVSIPAGACMSIVFVVLFIAFAVSRRRLFLVAVPFLFLMCFATKSSYISVILLFIASQPRFLCFTPRPIGFTVCCTVGLGRLGSALVSR